MKKYIKARKYIHFQTKHSKKQEKRNLNHYKKKKEFNKSLIGKSIVDLSLKNQKKQFEILNAPKNFSLLKYTEETIEFINILNEKYDKNKKVYVNLQDVEYLDYSAVTVLLSVMFKFKSKGIEFNGNFPSIPELKTLLINSGFLKYLTKPIGNRVEYSIGNQNQILTRANKKVNPELGFAVMKEASNTIWGEPRTCKGLQRVLLELMQNTNNHADLSQKGTQHWWLSVNHNIKDKKVSFVFVDYGIGIFESLKQKPSDNKWFGWAEKIKERLKYGSNEEILNLLLNGELHLTVTGQHFRGKGLPGVKQVFDRNQISNLHIISNDVYAGIPKKRYKLLTNDFHGTFVYWEITKKNVNLDWIGEV